MFYKISNQLHFLFFFISKKDVYSESYLMQKKHKADQRLQKKKRKGQIYWLLPTSIIANNVAMFTHKYTD